MADVGRQALGETRGLLGVLRADGSSDGLAPQPGLAALADLVAQTRATGLAATLDCAGDPAGLGADIQLAVYRIAQEAITNTLRHASRGRGGRRPGHHRPGQRRAGGHRRRPPGTARRRPAQRRPAGRRDRAGRRPGPGRDARARPGLRRLGDGRPGPYGWVVRAILPTERPAMSVRVLLVDDQALLRTGFRMVLEEQDDIEVVGEAADGDEAVGPGQPSCRPTWC